MFFSKKTVALGVAALLYWPYPLFADYTIILKNGRRITVESYREDGEMIKFSGLGGEIGISKSQVQSIEQAGVKGRGMVVPGEEIVPARPAPETEKVKVEKEKEERPGEAKEKGLSPEEQLAQERAKEEKEYQERLSKITGEIKSLRDRYALAARGTTSAEPGLLDSEQAIRKRTEDLNSRLRDSQYDPARAGAAGGLTLNAPSPFASQPPTSLELRPGAVVPRVDVPPPPYSETERELSDLRNQITRLENERKMLIEEMRQKNFDTGSFFLNNNP